MGEIWKPVFVPHYHIFLYSKPDVSFPLLFFCPYCTKDATLVAVVGFKL